MSGSTGARSTVTRDKSEVSEVSEVSGGERGEALNIKAQCTNLREGLCSHERVGEAGVEAQIQSAERVVCGNAC